MSAKPSGSDPYREERRRILRRAALYTYGFLIAAIAVAVIGAAIVAWLLSFTGVPFRETWLVLVAIILLVPLVGQVVEALRKRSGGRAGDVDDVERPGGPTEDEGGPAGSDRPEGGPGRDQK